MLSSKSHLTFLLLLSQGYSCFSRALSHSLALSVTDRISSGRKLRLQDRESSISRGHLHILFHSTNTFPFNHMTVSTYFHSCVSWRESLIDGSAKVQHATIRTSSLWFMEYMHLEKCLKYSSSVNFTWFVLFSYTKFDGRPLFKPGALCLICHQFELPQNKYFGEIKIISYQKFQTRQSLHLWKKKPWKIKCFFPKRFHLFDELPSYLPNLSTTSRM